MLDVTPVTPPAAANDGNNQAKRPVAAMTRAEAAYVKSWLSKYGKHMPLRQWSSQYTGIYNSWFVDEAQVAERYITTMGPLGVRGRQLDATWGENSSFKAQFPEKLIDDAGELVLNMYEVTQVIEGSPADGKVNVGDLVIAMDGQLLKSAPAIQGKYGPYQFQDGRGLDMHAGLLIDKAEAKGEITLTVISKDSLANLGVLKSSWQRLLSQRMDNHETRNKGLKLDVPVKGGQIVRLIVTDGGNGRGSDGFNWADLKLVPAKGGKEVPLDALSPSVYQVGYGEAKFDKEKGEWLAHAPSVLSFEIPQGEWKLTGRAAPGGAATVEAHVDLGRSQFIPPAVRPLCKNVKLKIDRIGSYADGFPNNCSKSRIVAGLLAGWLVAQQNENGSWDRPGGYTSSHYDTAWAGLALMSTGDRQYDPNIKKAAEFVAFSGTQDWWAVPASTAAIFLSEYWLKYRDNAVLPALRNQIERLKSEMLYGDFNTGHGIHPGYRGTGVSVGGSHMTLALALAAKTPARIDDGILDKMLDRAQQLAPAGYIPYGRMAEVLSFEPHIAGGATYSGRHSPYFIASLISGGPALFTKNCRTMYAKGAFGGADQGHSSETMSCQWALPALWNASPASYYKNMEAFRWKLTLMRTFDGGFCFNPNRTEYMGAEEVLHVYIRTASWLMGLCTERQELVITGKPGYRAQKFRNVFPVFDQESRLLNTYIRDWSLASAALGSKAPAGLVKGCAELKKIPLKEGCRYELMEFLSKNGLAVAKSILALQGVDNQLKNYAAEMVLGVNIRISFDPAREDDKPLPGSYQFAVDIQQPMGGRAIGLRNQDEAQKARDLLKWDFKGSVKFEGGNELGNIPVVNWDGQTRFGSDWNVYTMKEKLSGPQQLQKPLKLKAHMKYSVGDVNFDYERDITVGAFEVGNGEKERSVVNDRRVWVPGILYRDHGNWGLSFALADGTFISAASQGNQVMVHDKRDGKPYIWISPNDSSLLEGTPCYFYTASDWFGLECRVAEVRLAGAGIPYVKNIKVKASTDGTVKMDSLSDFDATTFEEIKFSDKKDVPLELEVTLPAPTAVRGVDIRIQDGWSKVVIEANVGGKWQPVHWGSMAAATGGGDKTMSEIYGDKPDIQRLIKLPGNGGIKSIRTFTPVTTNRLKIKLIRDNPGGVVKLSELRIYPDTVLRKTEKAAGAGQKTKMASAREAS